MSPSRQVKAEYSEEEAASALGVSVEQLRSLIKTHIANNDEELSTARVATFHASDLLLLRMLVKANPPAIEPPTPSE